MLRMFLNGKIRDIRITGTNLEYEGSITLDEEYLERAGILHNEEVHVLNVDTGTRLITYAIKGERNSGIVELNGPAARLGMKGDRVMVLTYAMLSDEEISSHEPKIVCVNP
ncbi:MAG: aspartate 1-decarboxylase [Chitinispirillaceae bacterium]|nr:aspartate 1-decarboxylase [Chitinispirillaceae bacterium]